MDKNKKMLIVLYGNANQGKTTTLMNLAISLAGGDSDMEKNIRQIFSKKVKLGNKRFNDSRIIIEYRGVFIYLATGGDYWSICRGNCDFFEGNFGNKEIYFKDSKGLRLMTPGEKASFRGKKPFVAISACRPNGDQYGAIKAVHAYNESHILDYSQQLWLKIDRTDDITSMASLIQCHIDEFIK